MDRSLQLTAPTISVVFEIDGVATNPSPNTATLEVLRSDGSTVVAAGTATTVGPGTGQFRFVLTVANTTLLDELTAKWTATLGGTPQTIATKVQIVGGFLFSLAEARLRSPLDSTTDWPAATLAGLRTEIEEDLERACGVAFVPRYTLERRAVPTGCRLRLNRREIRSVRSISVDGTAWSAGQLALLRTAAGGWIEATQGWGYALPSSTVVVGYEHGFDYSPRPVSDAALDLAAFTGAAAPGNIDPRATSIVTQDGSINLSIGGGFGLPSVDRIVQRYGELQVW